MTCDHGLRWGDITVSCAREMGHDDDHQGSLHATKIGWLDGDRRDFTGDDPGPCPSTSCILPNGHPGGHAY